MVQIRWLVFVGNRLPAGAGLLPPEVLMRQYLLHALLHPLTIGLDQPGITLPKGF